VAGAVRRNIVMADKARKKAQDKAGGNSERRDTTQLRRVADRILHKNLRLNEILLDSLPHPAMLIRKDRTILAANRIARQLGAKVGEYCWQSFGQSEFIPEKDKQYINDHKQVPPGGTCCVFCQADEALDKQFRTGNAEVKAWDKIWDMHWIPLDEETYLHYGIDVTHISREDEKVRMSELKYRSLAQNIPGLVYRILTKQNNRMLFFNTMLEAMTGFTERELEKSKVCSVEPHILDEDRDKIKEAVRHGCDEKEPFEVEYRFRHKNGDIKWFKEIGRPTFGPGDELLFIDGIITDITERKETEEALEESEEKFRNLADHSPNMIFINQKGRVVYANDKCEELMGYTKEEFYAPDFDFRSLIAPEFRDLVEANFDAHLHGEEIAPFEYELVNKKDERIYAILTTKLIKYEGQDAILGTVTNITARKQAEEQLRSSEEKYRVLFEGHAEPVTILDRDGIVLMVNSAGARNIGLSQEESVGKSIFEVLPGMDDSLHEVYQQVIDTGISVTREDFLEVPSGRRWFWSVHQPVSDINGTRYGVQIISYDITERKQAEEALQDRGEKWRSLAETAPVVIMNVSRDGTIKFINRVLERHTLEQVIGTHVYDHVPQDQHDIMRKSLERVFETGKPDSFENLRGRPGRSGNDMVRKIISGRSLIRAEKLQNVTMVAINITERKRIEKALKSERDFTETALNAQEDTFFVLNHQPAKRIDGIRPLARFPDIMTMRFGL